MTTVGAIFRPQLPPERLRSVAQAADEAGLEELWLWEDCFREGGIATAAAALAWTERLRLGIGVLPLPLRNVALTAMELATLQRMFPGRLVAGVGHGVQDWMEQVGARVDSPVTLMREQVDALRALLAGQHVTTEGRYVRLDGVRLDWPLTPVPGPPPVVAGVEGPRSLRLSGACADGTVLTGGTTPDGVRRARQLIDEGRAEAGRADLADPHVVTVYVVAATGERASERVETECHRWGWTSAVDRAVAGGVDEVAAGLAAWASAGADAVVLQPTEDEPDPEAFVTFAAAVGKAMGSGR